MDLKNKITHLSLFIVLLLTYINNTFALYSSNSPVKVLNAQQFKTLLNSGEPFVVEFFAPWCGHCQKLVPEMESAAKALEKVIKLVAVEDKEILGQYNVSGIPTIMTFIGNKKGEVFKKGNTASVLVPHVMSQLTKMVNQKLTGKTSSGKKSSSSSDVVVLTDGNFEQMVLNNEDAIWFVKFYAPWCGHCKSMASDWEMVASQLKGKIHVGKLDATTEKMMASRFEISGYPTLLIFPSGKKPKTSYESYSGPRNSNEIVDFAMKYFQTAAKLEQMISQEQFKSKCQKTVCIISFLPHLLDEDAKARNKYLEIITQVMKSSATTPVQFLWSQGSDQFKFEEKLNLMFGYPAVVAINLDKSKFSVHKGSLTVDSLKSFVIGLMGGKIPVENLRELPELKTVKKWDGKDAEPLKEEL